MLFLYKVCVFLYLSSYCKLVMTESLWFSEISALYFSSSEWRQLCLALLIHRVLLSLPQPNKTDHFTMTYGDRETICWVYLYNILKQCQLFFKSCRKCWNRSHFKNCVFVSNLNGAFYLFRNSFFNKCYVFLFIKFEINFRFNFLKA